MTPEELATALEAAARKAVSNPDLGDTAERFVLQLAPAAHAGAIRMRKAGDQLTAVAQDQDATHGFSAQQLPVTGKPFRAGQRNVVHGSKLPRQEGQAGWPALRLSAAVFLARQSYSPGSALTIRTVSTLTRTTCPIIRAPISSCTKATSGRGYGGSANPTAFRATHTVD